MVVALLATLATSGCKKNESNLPGGAALSCEKLFQTLERGGTVDFKALSCEELTCLRSRYETIATAKPQGTPTTAEYQKAQRAVSLIGQIDTARVWEGKCK
jgi:hypothetical protein